MSFTGKLLLLAVACLVLMGYAPAQPLVGGQAVQVFPLGAPESARAREPVAAAPESRAPAIGAIAATGGGLPAGPVARERAIPAPAAVNRSLLFPVAAIPEPSGWMLVLCSFVAVGIIARRKSRRVWG